MKQDINSYKYIIKFTLNPSHRWNTLYWFCNDNFGEVNNSPLTDDNWIWAVRANRDNDIFLIFREVEDYTLFKLIWEYS